MLTLTFSKSEFETLTCYWERYVKLKSGRLPNPFDEAVLKRECEALLEELSEETRNIFLNALDNFKLQGIEFQVKIAPDDASLVN